jgi:hypothetical protein
VVIQYLGSVNAQAAGRFLGFLRSYLRQRDSAQDRMPGIAVSQGNELDGMSKRHELRGCSTELKLAVIRMRPYTENPELKIWHARQYSDGIAGLSSSKRLHRCSVHHRTYLLSACYGRLRK